MKKLILLKLKHIIKRVVYFIKHGKDDYGKEGFYELWSKGKKVVPSDIVPHNEIWTTDKNGKVTKKIRL